MNDGMVFLSKSDFTEDDWLRLSFEFGFDSDKICADIHVIIDEN